MKTLSTGGKSVLIIVLCLSLVLLCSFFYINFDTNGCVDFHKENVGVVFSAYVKQRSENDEPIPNGWKDYSLESVKTMLNVISEKFARVTTYGVGADVVPYIRNSTYFQSFGQVYAAEAAALINKERNERVLTMLVGIWQSDVAQQMETEIALALESAQKANEIFPGTVEGLVFSNSGDLKRGKQALNNIRGIKGRDGLKLGSRQNCHSILNEDLEEAELTTTLRDIVRESDFIICEIYPSADKNSMLGTEISVEVEFLRIRNRLEGINANIEVMGQTGWPSKGTEDLENVKTLKEYWSTMNNFVMKHNFTIWMMEAFDNPWKNWAPRQAHFGWWSLKDNSEVELRNGYQEKATENHPCSRSDR